VPCLPVCLAATGERPQDSACRFGIYDYPGETDGGFYSGQIVSAYALTDTTTKTVCGELRGLRLEMKYSIGEMAQLLGIPKGTYQGYETGRRPMPAGFINRVREWRQIDLDFFTGMDGRIEQQLLLDGFTQGIPSDVVTEG
jgi:hypothetical protein